VVAINVSRRRESDGNGKGRGYRHQGLSARCRELMLALSRRVGATDPDGSTSDRGEEGGDLGEEN